MSSNEASTAAALFRLRSMQRKRKRTSVGASVRPNYFLSVRCDDGRLRERAAEIQALATERDASLLNFQTPIAKFHITLFVMALQSKAAVAEAKAALQDFQWPVSDLPLPDPNDLHLTFTTLGGFKDQVVFIPPEPSPSMDVLRQLTAALHKHYADKQLVEEGSFEGEAWSPHATLFKTSKARKRPASGGRHRIRKEAWEGLGEAVKEKHQEPDLGIQRIEAVELLEMSRMAQDGFYRCRARIEIADLAIPLSGSNSNNSGP